MSTRRRLLRRAVWVLLALAVALLAFTLRVSNGVWYFRNAATPEGWPELTPVGEVSVREYPRYRAATVRAADLDGEGMESMFRRLFRHIDESDIAMTAPVEMGWGTPVADRIEMASMAFLYRDAETGRTGEEGPVVVRDLPAVRVASIGIRGDYDLDNFRTGVARLRAWLADEGQDWEAAGEPRYLGYNGPFVPSFWRYGEVQLPVRHRNT